LHAVIASECTGCELCLKPCPVECIHMVPIPTDTTNWKWPFPATMPAPGAPQTAAGPTAAPGRASI
jgi:electron transport complex protein RnfB